MVGTTILIIVLLALDRFTKIVLAGWLEGRDLVEIIPGVLGLRLLPGGNDGAAFGLFSNSTVFLTIITAVVLVAMIYALYVKKLHSKVLRVALALIIAGGIGNLFDRIAYGTVTDFIEFLFIRFPTFNIADCCITIGAVIAIAYLLFSGKDTPLFAGEKKPAQSDPSPDAEEEQQETRDEQ